MHRLRPNTRWTLSKRKIGQFLFGTLAIGGAVYFLILYVLPPIQAYNHFHLLNFDYGILFHSSHLLSRFYEPFMTTRGLYVWADNQDYFQWAFAPFHYLPASHYWLLILHSLGIYACGVFCLFVLWRQGSLVALSVTTAVWSSPFLINMNIDIFHTEAFATIFILMLYFSCKTGRTSLFYLFLALALSCKEDVALTVGFFMALALMTRGRFDLKRIHFVSGLVISIAWFAINLKLLLPHFKALTCLWLNPDFAIENIGSSLTAPWFQDILSKWYRPSFIKEAFFKREVGLYILKVMWPAVFFVRSWFPFVLLPGAALFVNILSGSNYLIEGFYHYDFCTMAAIIIIILEGIAKCNHKRTVSVVMLIAAICMNLFGQRVRMPLPAAVTKEFYDFSKEKEVRFLEDLNEVLPEETIISADYNSINYLLSGHPYVYMFENPFQEHYFGIYGECSSFKQKPTVDIVLIKEPYNIDAELHDLLSSTFIEVLIEGIRISVWVSPSFLESPNFGDLRRKLETYRLEAKERQETLQRQPNLVKNGDFEDVVSGKPRYWRFDLWQEEGAKNRFKVDMVVNKKGKYSAKVVHNNPADSRWVQVRSLEPDTEYHLSGWIKTEDISELGAGAYLEVEGTDIKTKVISGTKDWQFVEAFGRTKRSPTKGKVQCRLGEYGSPNTGTAYFDAIELKTIPPSN